MGWDGVKLEKNESELDCLKKELVSDEISYVAHSYDKNDKVYYFALKHKDNITATIVSMNSYKREREKGWIYFKVIDEEACPIYSNPSKKVFAKLTHSDKNFDYEWRNRVKKIMDKNTNKGH